MKLCLISDTHYGIRQDNKGLLDYFKRFLDDVFFPELEKQNIKHIIHLGDLVDRRRYINTYTAHRLNEDFLKRLDNYEVHMIAGNHDVYFKDTNEVNIVDRLIGSTNVNFYTKPVEKQFDKLKVLFLPWIANDFDAEQQAFEAITNSEASILFGHLELRGYEMDRGTYCDGGLPDSLFDGFHAVYSGHFHHKSTHRHINYLGCPWEMSWADFNDPKGFHILDTETLNLQFIENPYKMFHKIHYSDQGKTFDQVMDLNFDSFRNSCVKVIVKNKDNPYWFDQYIQKLEIEAAFLTTVEDHLNLQLETDDDIVNQAQSTLEILHNSVKQGGVPEKYEKPLINLLTALYDEAALIQT